MIRKNKSPKEKIHVAMYNNRVDSNDIVSCYFDALNQFKPCSYITHINDIDMYNNLSILEYKSNEIGINEINTNQYE
ncbi:MAG: hypothetical protein RRZ84_05670 [Romboutsia sp.]